MAALRLSEAVNRDALEKHPAVYYRAVKSNMDQDGVESMDTLEASDIAVGMQDTAHRTSGDDGVSPELQAEILNEFLHVLSELDEVLDASLLQDVDLCLLARPPLSDDDDVVCPTAPLYEDLPRRSGILHRADDNATSDVSENVYPHYMDHFGDTSEDGLRVEPNEQLVTLEHDNQQDLMSVTTAPHDGSGMNECVRGSQRELDDARGSMRRLEPLTLPVLLFLEHHVNMRPSSAPLQLQRWDRAESEGHAAVVGRHSLLQASESVAARWPVATAAERPDDSAHERSSSSASSTDSGDCLQIPTITHAIAENAEETLGSTGEIQEEEEEEEDTWQHSLSPALACLSCTIGLFNISRFAVFSVHFGAGWVVQWAVLSLGGGVPLLALHTALGRVLASGALDMWRISPVLRGVGAALLAAQLLLGVYSVVGVSWLLVYFRDSFITTDDTYRWAMPHTEGVRNLSGLHETMPHYWSGEVLQRSAPAPPGLGAVKFQTAFNLAVVWMIVFVSLSKGLRSYGKAVYVLVLAPVSVGAVVLTTKLLVLAVVDSPVDLFPQTHWSEFFLNTNSWAAAAQEAFLTWGLLGACAMQLAAHGRGGAGGGGTAGARALRRELAAVAAAAAALLLLAACLANVCVLALRRRGYLYVPASYETISSGQFLWLMSEPLPPHMASTPVRFMAHYGSVVGVTVWRTPGDAKHSGWQPLQFATQLVPAALAVLTAKELSPVWAVMFYFILILLGVAQQLAIWHGVITGIVAINPKALRPWKTSITFFSCLFGLLAGLVLTTDGGIHVVHWLDYVVTGAWWQCLLQAVLLCGVFLVRGRPYSGDAVVTALLPAGTSRLHSALAALLSFIWTLVLPVLLIVMCVVEFRAGRQRQLYGWRRAAGTPAGYWAPWARRCGAALQQAALLLVPVVAAVQTYRYMNKGPDDVLERIQSLYRPRMDERGRRLAAEDAAPLQPASAAAPPPDPPPKYTPPPSYSTATGARLLATLRRSFRAVRRLTASAGDAHAADAPQLPISLSESVDTSARAGGGGGGGAGRAARNSLSLGARGGGAGGGGGGARRMRASLRKSFKFGPRGESRERLARGAEPPSSTVAMTTVLTRDTL